MSKWFEELGDDLWLPPDEQGEEEALFIKRALRLRKGQRVLDAPCGAGRVAVHLALAGCEVTCADLRKAFVSRAKRRFKAEGASGSFSVLDLRDLEWSDEFHGVYNWGGSFGYFDDATNAELVRRYARALRRGGRLVIEQQNRERILRHFLREVTTERRISRNRWDRRRQRVESSYWVKGAHRPADRSSMRLYTPAQMRTLYQQAGLSVECVYGDWQGSDYSRSGPKIIMVGRKGAAG